MRSLLFALALVAGPAAAQPTAVASAADAVRCAQAVKHVADQIGSYRGRRPEPRKLNQLPPATGYMAVYRRVNGCEVPLTMVDYRRRLRH